MNIVICGVLAFCIAAVLGPLLIPLLKHWKFGQSIREEGPSWHQKKSGTPTVGGVIFIPAALVMGLLFYPTREMLLLCVSSLAFGLIGFADDAIKIIKKHNLGLTARQKFLLQVLAAGVLIIGAVRGLGISTAVQIPFGKSIVLAPALYYPLMFFFVVGMVNAVNLTDGIDGLASSVSLVVAAFFAVLCYRIGEPVGAGFAAAVCGGCAGFLIFNAHPAKVFMGDTGSLFLGGALSALSIVYGLEFFWLIAGLVFVGETLSVIIQVTSFKLTGKRVFKMSPIHHHFEMCGWSEWKIVGVFSGISLLLGAGLLLIL